MQHPPLPAMYVCVCSLYGTPSSNDHVWDVLSMDFQAVFPRNCSSSDFYDWHPWDDRTDQACLLGSDVTIQRRNSSVCCLIGRTYSRPTSFTVCSCTADDFEWYDTYSSFSDSFQYFHSCSLPTTCSIPSAYGYQHADSFNGKCVRDSSVTLDPICTTSDQELYKKSRGYQKVAGDVCVGGVEEDFLPMMAPCRKLLHIHFATSVSRRDRIVFIGERAKRVRHYQGCTNSSWCGI